MTTDRKKATREQIAFAAADTICFFSPSPADLLDLQRREWLPVVDWINGNGCDFKTTDGIETPTLSGRTTAFLENRLNALTDEVFYAFCAVSGGCRSVILALAVLDGFITAERAFDLAVLEESYQNKIWRGDPDALMAREGRRKAVLEAAEKLKGKKNG
ncbi:MAG: hypothetical protein IKR09_08785 [Alphaproteobacteria bacterium]|nr:hypothetical protein [Alphaproteobacteria bacterium]